MEKLAPKMSNESQEEFLARKRAYMKEYQRVRRATETPDQRRKRLDQIKQYEDKLKQKFKDGTATEDEVIKRMLKKERAKKRRALTSAKIAAGEIPPKPKYKRKKKDKTGEDGAIDSAPKKRRRKKRNVEIDFTDSSDTSDDDANGVSFNSENQKESLIQGILEHIWLFLINSNHFFTFLEA